MSFTSHLKSNLSKYLAAVAAVAALAALALAAAGCGQGQEVTTPLDDVSTEPITVSTINEPITRDAVQELVTRKVGQEGLHGAQMVRDIRITPDSGGFFVEIDTSRPTKCVASNCAGDDPARVINETVDMSRNIMSTLFLYTDVTKVQLNVFGVTDNYGDEDKQAVSVTMTRQDADRVDWSDYTPQTFSKLATSVWLEAHLQQYLQQQLASPAASTSSAP